MQLQFTKIEQLEDISFKLVQDFNLTLYEKGGIITVEETTIITTKEKILENIKTHHKEQETWASAFCQDHKPTVCSGAKQY